MIKIKSEFDTNNNGLLDITWDIVQNYLSFNIFSKTYMCPFVSMLYSKIKFKIDTNNDEIFRTV